MKFNQWRISEVRPDSKVVHICCITGLSTTIFLAKKLAQFLPDDSFLVMEILLPEGYVYAHNAFTRDKVLSPYDCSKVPVLANLLF